MRQPARDRLLLPQLQVWRLLRVQDAVQAGDLAELLPAAVVVDVVVQVLLPRADLPPEEFRQRPLADEALPVGPARGLSNRRTVRLARISVRAGLLVAVETNGDESDL